eukprot:TRINITY_DN7604_c0_g1_i3.p1 TRINITY_DN7604_c0_g1~~TRINITY_DN7604_c0_g1_i3.p1  ORF type:complete len:189 (+),score=29.00 TRINITY_DN7604_c0_g1_i3:513-1079(+)
MYSVFLKWLTVLKLDALYTITSAFVSGKGIYNEGYLLGLDILVIILSIVFIVLGYFSIRRELVPLTIVWFCIFPLMTSYLLYNLYETWDFNLHSSKANYASHNLGGIYTITSSIALVSHLVLIGLTVKVYNNFGKGLKNIQYGGMKVTSKKDNNNDDDIEYEDFEGDEPFSVDDVIKNTVALQAPQKS